MIINKELFDSAICHNNWQPNTTEITNNVIIDRYGTGNVFMLTVNTDNRQVMFFS